MSDFLSMFRAGKNTYEIAAILHYYEHDVDRGIHQAREMAT